MPWFTIRPEPEEDGPVQTVQLSEELSQLITDHLDILTAIHGEESFTVPIFSSSGIQARYAFAPFVVSYILRTFTAPLKRCFASPVIDVRADDSVSRLQLFELEDRLRLILENNALDIAKDEEESDAVLNAVLSEVIQEVRIFSQEISGDDLDFYSGDFEIDLNGLPADVSWQSDAIRDDTIITRYLGQFTPDYIQGKIGNQFKILHSEVILRDSLLRGFEDFRSKLYTKHRLSGMSRRAADGMADKVFKEEVVFHGTLRKNVASIVVNGFRLPGQKTTDGEHQVRCGSTWGRGIYSSPDPSYSFSYADHTAASQRRLPGYKVVVAACLMGKRYQLKAGEYMRTSSRTRSATYDSHVSPSKLEYVVFNSAQLLPILVLHIDHADSTTRVNESVLQTKLDRPDYDEMDRVGMKLKDRRAILATFAMRNLPDGFGPRGRNFIVEEVGEVDEDDEQFGDYQALVNLMAGSAMDEFQQARFRGITSED
ncbi:hypothetical protein BT69DRAFT_1284978 [Atractiella rhizophila]|nr:hypothetical protein BT69DRAFT_1284978 [Atractiella rhizophila]